MNRSVLTLTVLFVLMALALVSCIPAKLADGEGEFFYHDMQGSPFKPIKVWYYLPADTTESSPIVFVMHGMSRNAEGYRKPWIPLADQYGFVLVLPEFSSLFYPGSRPYNLGNVTNAMGGLKPEAKWTFSTVDRLFDDVKARTGNTSERYYIYGHSAGGQFVHRLVLLKPQARIAHAVAANAGWYTMPTFDTKWAYGLANSPATPETLDLAFKTPLTILLGDRDTDPNHSQLNRSPQANAQGAHRFARGHTFFETAQTEAATRNTPLEWDLRVVPGVGHSNGGVAPDAADVFFGGNDRH